MGTAFIVVAILFTHVNGMNAVDKEFNRNIFEDDMEYTFIDPNYSQEAVNNDAENQYFRQVRAFEEDYKNFELIDREEGYFTNVPKFRSNYRSRGFTPRNEYEEIGRRMKRNTDDEKNLQIAVQIERDIEKHLGKPLEIAVLDLENATEVINNTQAQGTRKEKDLREPENNVIINDFIRFKRDASNLNNTEFSEESDGFTPTREKESNERQEKMLLAPDDEIETSREPRGATKEQWIKQPYPVRNSNADNYEDNAASNSEAVRGPRVHFVTQRRSESAPPPVYRSFDRDSRARDLAPEISREFPREYERNYYQRPPRHYETYPSPPPYRRNYYRNEYPRDRPPYDTNYESGDKFKDVERPVQNKQRRIIYYATLPEIVRTPPNVDLRDRYNYRDRYDNRFVSSAPVAVADADPYRYRKPYPATKSRYDNIQGGKTPYLKVSTDVNVREIKKNPERRIYSEGDRRYAYGVPPYRPDEVPYGRRP